jgi:hypothetical protein
MGFLFVFFCCKSDVVKNISDYNFENKTCIFITKTMLGDIIKWFYQRLMLNVLETSIAFILLIRDISNEAKLST